MARKNDLLEQPLRKLLAYKDQPGTYSVDRMLDALTMRPQEEIDALSEKEQKELEEFIGTIHEEQNTAWMRRFFAKQQDRVFGIVDVAMWAIDTLGYFVGSDAESQRNFACDTIMHWKIIVEDFANKGFIERIPEVPHGRYRVAITDDNPLIDVGGNEDDEKPPEKEPEDIEPAESA